MRSAWMLESDIHPLSVAKGGFRQVVEGGCQAGQGVCVCSFYLKLGTDMGVSYTFSGGPIWEFVIPLAGDQYGSERVGVQRGYVTV